jgi:excisionase family DNA binding protein
LRTNANTAKVVVATNHYKELKMAVTPKTITVPEAGAEYFGLSRGASYEAAKRGEIPTIKIGKLLRVPVRALEDMLNAARAKSQAA